MLNLLRATPTNESINMKTFKQFLSESKQYPPEQVIAAFTQLYKETGNSLDGGECGDAAFMYHLLNSEFEYYGILSDDEDENLAHIVVKYNGKLYDGQGELNDKYEYQPVKFNKGSNFHTSTYEDDAGHESAVGGGDGHGQPHDKATYRKLLAILEK